MTQLKRLTFVGALLILTAFVAFIAYYLSRPTYLRVAVGPEGTEMNRVMSLIQQAQMRDRAAIRLTPVSYGNIQQSAQALGRGEVDLMVLRSDSPFPVNAQVVAVWQRDPLILITRKEGGINRFSDLSGRRVAILGSGANAELLKKVLRHSDVDFRTMMDMKATVSTVGEMMQSRQCDAVFIVSPITSRLVRDTVSHVARAIGADNLKIVPIKEAEAMSARITAFEPMELVEGALLINPPLPEETIDTVQVSHLLIASRETPEATVEALTAQLFMHKQAIAALDGSSYRIEAANTEKDAIFPVHPGAQAYYSGNQKTFLERYSDFIYLGIFGLSLGGSGIAGIATYLNASKRRKNREVLHEVVHLVRAARQAPDGDTLDQVSLLADEVFAGAIERSSHGDFDNGEFASLSLALDHLRAVIADRRRALQLEVMAYESGYFDEDDSEKGTI